VPREVVAPHWPPDATGHTQKEMLYDPDRDLYALLAVSARADEDEIRHRIADLRGTKGDRELDEAARVLLNLESRTRYDTERATHRMRALMRESVAVFKGRTPVQGVRTGWPWDAS